MRAESRRTPLPVAGMAVGAVGWGAVGDTYGRRLAFLGASLLTVAFGFASAAAHNFQSLLAFRTLIGLGVSGGGWQGRGVRTRRAWRSTAARGVWC